MNIRTLLILSIFCLLIMGCSSQTMYEQEVKDSNVDTSDHSEIEIQAPEPEVEKIPEIETEEEPEIEIEEDTQEHSTESSYDLESLPIVEQRKIKSVRRLLEEARSRDENYFFRYSAPGVLQSDVWIYGDKMKRSIIRAIEVDKFHKYNMIYMDSSTKQAKGYCETTKAICPEGHGPFAETYAKYEIKTPKDWVTEMGDDFYFVLDNKINDQLYHIIDYRKDGMTTRLFINNYRGWPARVEIYDKAKVDSMTKPGSAIKTYIYDDMDIGGVSEDDVIPGR